MGTAVETNSRADVAQCYSGPAFVLRLDKETQGRYPLNKARMVLGRSKRADIVLDESGGVSREHAHVLVVDGEVVVEDLGSRNGTFVNGRPTTRRTLRPGDLVAIGRYRLLFLNDVGDESDAEPPAASADMLLRRWRRADTLSDGQGCPLCRGAGDNEEEDALVRSQTMPCVELDDEEVMAKVDALINAPRRARPDAGSDVEAGAKISHGAREKFKSRKSVRKRKAARRDKLKRTRGLRV